MLKEFHCVFTLPTDKPSNRIRSSNFIMSYGSSGDHTDHKILVPSTWKVRSSLMECWSQLGQLGWHPTYLRGYLCQSREGIFSSVDLFQQDSFWNLCGPSVKIRRLPKWIFDEFSLIIPVEASHWLCLHDTADPVIFTLREYSCLLALCEHRWPSQIQNSHLWYKD